MGLLESAISRSWVAVAAASLSVAIGCGSDSGGAAGSGSIPPPTAGTIGTGSNPTTGVPGGGAAGTSSIPGVGTGVAGRPAGTGAAGTGVSTPPAGTGTGVAGAGSAGLGTAGASTGTIAGTGAANPEGPVATAGTSGGAAGSTATGGSPSTPPPTGGACDTASFMQNCSGGADQWGKPSMSGPCASGTTIYGVKTDYGPYGVKSKYNIGKMFNNGGNWDAAGCSLFIDSFGADPKGSADLKMVHDLDFGLYSVFYPGCMPEGQKFPVITWGNGTCAMPEGYGPLLRYVASFGYIVIAANNVQVGAGTPMLKALDAIFAEGKDAMSEFYQHVDEEKVGAMGHSQGGGATVSAASDPRIKAVIIWNGGTSAPKPFLAVSGDRDLGGGASSLRNPAEAAPRPAAWLFYHQIPAAVDGSTTGQLAPGHLTLMMEPERVQKVAANWWEMMFRSDAEAKKMFVGADCGICKGTELKSMWVMGAEANGPSHEYGANSMLK